MDTGSPYHLSDQDCKSTCQAGTRIQLPTSKSSEVKQEEEEEEKPVCGLIRYDGEDDKPDPTSFKRTLRKRKTNLPLPKEEDATKSNSITPGRGRPDRSSQLPVEIPPELLKEPRGEKMIYHCSVCGKDFTNAYKLERHELTHTGEKPYCCSMCGRGFNQKGNLKTHYKVHTEEESCSETQFVEDSDTVHQAKEPELQATSKPKKTHACLSCGKVFSRRCSLRRHLVIHSGNRPYRCLICGRGFKQSGTLKTHMKVHRGEKPIESSVPETSHKPEEPPVPTHVCGDCGMDFALKEQLEEHKKIHKELKPYFCSECGKSFKTKNYFKMHIRSHTEELPFPCRDCGKGFISPSARESHEFTHTGERNFSCAQCGKTFKQSSHVYSHLRTHTGERSHLCSICGKSYSNAHWLRVHMRAHTGEKPYTCEKCGKSFAHTQGYNTHLKTHGKQQPVKKTQ